MRALFVPVQGSTAFEVEDELVLIGRGDDCDIVLSDSSVSRHHCVLGLSGNGVLLRDLSSSNGCWVNGRRRHQALLERDDLLGIASLQFRLCLADDDTDALSDGSDTRDSGQTTSRAMDTPENSLYVGQWEEGQEVFEGCRLVERIGVGGFGEVWRARRDGYGDIAVKRIPLADPDRNERRALKAMHGARHRNLIRVFGCRRMDGILVVAMELGELTLDDLLTRYHRLGYAGIPHPVLLRYMRHVASALDYLYSEYSLLHRDVKPANVLLVRNVAKLSDFGLVKGLQATEGLHSGIGSYEYAPPEFFDQRMVRSSDQYSLATMYVQLATGHLPFPGPDVRQLMMQKFYHKPDLSGIKAGEHTVLLRSLSKDPKDRFESCTAFVEVLIRAQNSASRRLATASAQIA